MKNKIIQIATLILPLSVYLFLSATLFGVKPDLTIKETPVEHINVTMIRDDEYFLYGTLDTVYIGGVVSNRNGVIGALIDSDDVIKVGFKYYSYNEVDGVYGLYEQNVVNVEKGYKLPLAAMIVLVGIFVVALIYLKKLNHLKENPKLALLVTLWSLAISFYVLNEIVSNFANVFMIAAISWTAFLLEEKAFADKEKTNKVNSLLNDLEKRI